MEFSHIPVLFNEVIESLNINPNGIYVDGTAGGAGHSKGIAAKLTGGRLYALDQDPDAVAVATERLKGLPATVIHTNFKDMEHNAFRGSLGRQSCRGRDTDWVRGLHRLPTPAKLRMLHDDARE